MNSLVRQFFSTEEEDREVHFREVIFVNRETDLSWEVAQTKAPKLPRSWFELSRISTRDRIDFTRDLWLDLLSFHPKAHDSISRFFQSLDDIEVVLHRQSEEEPFSAELVYSLADNSSFFRGLPPLSGTEREALREEVLWDLPRDYWTFNRIHNGFGKLSELGLLQVEEITDERAKIVNTQVSSEQALHSGDVVVDPGTLIPFFISFGLASYQCFYADWYPAHEMGNVYLSGIDNTISDITDPELWSENLAFPTFVEWLAVYLQGMDDAPETFS